MEKVLKIFLIEDEQKNVENVQKTFAEAVEKLKSWNLMDEMKFQDIETEWVKGADYSVKKKGKEYYFYTEDVIEELDKRVEENPDKKKGILLDVVLTKTEQQACDSNNFDTIELSRKIYDHFEGKCGLYLITGLRSFGTLGWSIFGRENLAQQYIPRELAGDYSSCMAISQALYRLNNGKQIPEGLLRKIEEKELAE